MHGFWPRVTAGTLPPPREGVVAAVLVPLFEDAQGAVRVILTKRPDHMPTHAGELAFPGGRLEAGDADAVEAALREAWEEVGIPPEDVEVLGALEPVTTARATMVVLPVVGRLPGRPHLIPNPTEVDKVLWPRVEVFLDESRWRTEDWGGHTLWFFEVEGEILWGATARMMRNLLDLVR